MTGAGSVRRDVLALLAFRLGTGRRSGRQLAVAAGLALGVAAALPLAVARFAPPTYRADVATLSPTVWALFLVSAVVAAVVAAGGRELLPRDQAVAFPVSPAADHVGALLLMPLNVSWSLQAAVLLGAMGYAVGWGPELAPALLATVTWVVAATCVAQLGGWLAELARTYAWGRVLVRVVALTTIAAAGTLVLSGRSVELLDSPATSYVYVAALGGDPGRWLVVLAVVAAAGAVAAVVAVPAVGLLARRPPVVVRALEAGHHRRLGDPLTPLRAAVRLDRRSLRRLAPVRRGLALLVLVPVVAGVVVDLPWAGITLLPALVASGTALLYGVNAGVLDGPGAVWRESLPGDPDPSFLARSLVLAGICAATSTVVVLVAAARSTAEGSLAEVVAAALAVVVAVAQVVSRCQAWSLSRPFAATLRHPRDTPAPPLAMARYSLQLSVWTSLVAVVLAVTGGLGAVALPVAVAVVAVAAAAQRWLAALRRHREPGVRSRVAATVAGS